MPALAFTLSCRATARPGTAAAAGPRRAPRPAARTAAAAARRVALRRVPAVADDDTVGAVEPETVAEAAGAEAEEGPNPWQILKVSKGTSYQGLVVARQNALQEADGDEEKIELVDWAFNKFVDGSRQHFQKALDEAPEDPDAMFQMGNYEQTLENYALAEEWYRKALTASGGEHVDSLNQLAMLEQQVNQNLDAAEELYLGALKIAPEDVDILFNVAMLRLGKKDLDGVREMVAKIVELKPELEEHPLVAELATV